MTPDEKKQPDFPPEKHHLRLEVLPPHALPKEYQKEGLLIISGITIGDCHFLANFLHTCWHHDRHTLGGILVGINPSNMNAYWEFGCNLHHGPRRTASVHRRKHRQAA